MRERLDIEFDEHDLAEVLARFNALPRQIDAASVSAINRVASYARTHWARAVARRNRIPVSALRRRKRVASVRANRRVHRARIWIGYNPLSAAAFGTPRQTPHGARAGRQVFEGAFVQTIRRKSNYTGIFEREGKSRFPIEHKEVELEGVDDAARALLPTIRLRLRDEMARQLNYRVNVRGAR